MSERDKLLASIATTAQDYRAGGLKAFDVAHVDRWIRQFAADAQLPVLREMDHVLKSTYLSKVHIERFLQGLLQSQKIAGGEPKKFWQSTKFLDIQGGGGSQTDLLDLLDGPVKALCGIGVRGCGGGNPITFAYVDDVLATGGRIGQDLAKWVTSDAPKDCDVHVIVMAHHTNGGYQVTKDVGAAIKAAGKKVRMHWWRLMGLENQRYQRNDSDVLWPAEIPNDADVLAYVDELKNAGYPPELRAQTSIGKAKIFSSIQERHTLEQLLLLQSVKILKGAPGPFMLNVGSTLLRLRSWANKSSRCRLR